MIDRSHGGQYVSPREIRFKAHGTPSAYNAGCRCDECKASNRDRIARCRRKLRERSDEAPHGTLGGYVNWGCRCEDCGDQHSAYLRFAKANRLARPEDIPHGTVSGYHSWNCRCARCRAAASTYRKAHPRTPTAQGDPQ